MSDAQAAPATEDGVQVAEAPVFKVFVGNLAYVTTCEGLMDIFAPLEHEIVSKQIIYRGKRSAGYGFVAFSSAEAAQKVVDTLNKTELDGRPIIVEHAKEKALKVMEKKERRAKRRQSGRDKASSGELSEELPDANANGVVGNSEGGSVPVTEEAVKPKPKKKKKKFSAGKSTRSPEDGAAEINEEDTAETKNEDGTAETQKAFRRKSKTPRRIRPAGEDPVGEPSKTMLFVANLGFNVDDDGLTVLFTDAGINVTSARIVRRRWGQPRKSKGYGFVDVGSEDEQKKAIAALEGKEVGGRVIVVKIAVDTLKVDADDGPSNGDS